MSDSIVLTRSYTTNGRTVPAGRVSVDDLRDLMRNEKGEPATEAEAKSAQQDLLRREANYGQYMKGIHESTRYTHNGGTQSVGDGGE